MTADAGRIYQLISVLQAKEKIETGTAQVVDVRSPNDYAGGHLPGALNLPLVSVKTRGEHEMERDKELIFVDSNGQRAPQACEAAASLGFEKLYVVDGGTEAWLSAGYETETVDLLR